MREVIGAQGEIVIFKIDNLPVGMKTKEVEKIEKGTPANMAYIGHAP